ncbi:hypothetical protein ACFV1U_16900 [Streptomyces microflavus]|uniref:hypothetical protein n=1 Tax=Streptomyces microflavus TaxID=1919 RepID=UPI00368AF21A
MTTTPKGPTMTIDPNHRALLRAVGKLTTQVGRIADTLAPPVVTDDDGAQTTGDDAPATSGAEKQRTIRRQKFRILLNQLNAGVTPLTTAQVQALTAYVADEIVECNMETQEADRLEGDVKLLRAELDRIYTPRTISTMGRPSLTIGDQLAMTANLEEITAAIDRVRTALDDRPALCTDSVYERGWNDATEVVRSALAAPATEG